MSFSHQNLCQKSLHNFSPVWPIPKSVMYRSNYLSANTLTMSAHVNTPGQIQVGKNIAFLNGPLLLEYVSFAVQDWEASNTR